MLDYKTMRCNADHILVERYPIEDVRLKSGLIIPKHIQKHPEAGVVLSVGPRVKNVKEGDEIIFVNVITDLSPQYAVTTEECCIATWVEK